MAALTDACFFGPGLGFACDAVADLPGDLAPSDLGPAGLAGPALVSAFAPVPAASRRFAFTTGFGASGHKTGCGASLAAIRSGSGGAIGVVSIRAVSTRGASIAEDDICLGEA